MRTRHSGTPIRGRAGHARIGDGAVRLALLLGLFAPPAAFGGFPGANGLIAFQSDRDGNEEIYVVRPDGSGLANLTNHPDGDYEPQWSPDGTKIVFRRGEQGDIWVMNADGSGQTRLTHNEHADEKPSWSPDGTRIVFHSDRDGQKQIYVMRADGSGATNLSNDVSEPDREPVWSPDGSKIAFRRGDDDEREIWVMNPDGSGRTQLTSNEDEDEDPGWSPDGARIVFESDRTGGKEIWFMYADGTVPVQLTAQGMDEETDPEWSPDGTRIVFHSARDGNEEIYGMNPDGSAPVRVTDHPADDGNPSWQPIPPNPMTPSTTTTTTLPGVAGSPLGGSKLVLADRPDRPRKRALTLVAKDRAVGAGVENGTAGDPVLHGGFLGVVSASGGFDTTYELPAASWRYKGKAGKNKGYVLKNAGPVRKAIVKPGKGVAIVARGEALGHGLGTDPNPVHVTVGLGGQLYCFEFGGRTKFAASKKYVARKSRPPAACRPTTGPARVEIVPGAALLTGAGETRRLAARVFDAAGHRIAAAVTWTSSAPERVAIGADGRITAQVDVGSSQIVASAGGVRSPPALALVAEPAPGAVLVRDADIVGEPEVVEGTPAFGVGTRYRITLNGRRAPAPGTILLAAEGAQVGGRVVAVEKAGRQRVVTLEVVPLDEMFTALALDEVFDLSSVDVVVPDEILALYDVMRGPDQRLEFRPKAGAVPATTVRASRPAALIQAQAQDFRLGPLDCEADGSLPLLSPGLPSFNLTPRGFMLPIRSGPGGRITRIALKGSIELDVQWEATLSAAGEGSVECEVELGSIPLPIGGPVGVAIGASVPLGFGFELSGKVNVGGIGVVTNGKAVGSVDIRYTFCRSGPDCGVFADPRVDLAPGAKWFEAKDLPDFSDLSTVFDATRVEIEVHGGPFAKLALKPRWLPRRLSLSFFKFSAGATLALDLASVAGQLLDPEYASTAILRLAAKGGTDFEAGVLERLQQLLDVELDPGSLVDFTSPPKSRSPTALAASADIADFRPNETVRFTVSLDPAHVTFFPIGYAVREVRIYRLKDMGSGLRPVLVAAVPAVPGQTEFQLRHAPPDQGTIDGNFFAMAVTAAPVPGFPYELTFVTSNPVPCMDTPTSVMLDVAADRDPAPWVEGPVLQDGALYRVTLDGTLSIWTRQWESGVCKGTPGAGVGGPTGEDAHYWFAIPNASALCGSDFDCCPNEHSRIRLSVDGGATFEHPDAENHTYNAAHVYTHLVRGRGERFALRWEERNARADDYGVIKAHIACAAATATTTTTVAPPPTSSTLPGTSTTTAPSTTTSSSTSPSSTTSTTTTSSTTTTLIGGTPVIPYRRYAATGPDGPVLGLDDEFAMELVDLGPVVLELPPVAIDGVPPLDPTTHQTCYAHPGRVLDTCLDVQTAFGFEPVRIGAPVAVCVPERFSTVAVDAFECYAAEGAPFGQDVGLLDEFQPQTVTIGAPDLLCTPVAVDGSTLVNPARYLVCYGTEPPGSVGGQIQVENDLHGAPIQVDVGSATGLCVPAVRQVGATCQLCGNGVTDGSEECDDANTTSGDGCSSVCRLEP